MLVGKMEELTDQDTKNMIWRKGDTMFYKKGVTDPEYCVLNRAGHNLQIEQPELFQDIVKNWLKDNE